jgi:chromosome segregation ATPase
MPLVAWILLALLVGAVAVAAGLYLALRRARTRAARTDELVAEARRAVRAAADEEAARASEQIRVVVTRTHADSLSDYVTEERRLSDERRGELAVRERELSEQIAEMVAAVERRAEERLRAWEADLERAQRALEGEVTALAQRQAQRIAHVEARIEAEASELGTTAEQQRVAAVRLREELERTTRETLTEALEELQLQADDRRRTIDDLNERLRQHEHAVGEQIDRAENEARTRIEQAFAELERRQVAELERETAREVARLSEAGALEFENRMKAIREEAASRLREDLDRSTEGFLRRADALISTQLQQTADSATRQLEDRIAEVTRRFEALRPPAGV